MDFTNEHELRAFLRICIEPGERRDKRTPVRLAAAMPPPVLTALAEHAPNVDALRTAADAAAQRAEESRNAYATALLSWIRGERPTRHVRGLVAAGEEHVTDCVACSENGVISHRCADGRRLVASFLAPSLDAEEEPPCRHESWEVTGEYAEGQQWKTWVQSRRCTDCREPLPDLRSAEPHFPQQRDGDTAEAAAALGHAGVEDTTAAYGTFEQVARERGIDGLRPRTTGWIYDDDGSRIAAVHIYTDPRAVLTTEAVDEAREAIRRGLTPPKQ